MNNCTKIDPKQVEVYKNAVLAEAQEDEKQLAEKYFDYMDDCGCWAAFDKTEDVIEDWTYLRKVMK